MDPKVEPLNVLSMLDLFDHTAVSPENVMLTGTQLESNKAEACPVS
jgi:hypothetical protein